MTTTEAATVPPGSTVAPAVAPRGDRRRTALLESLEALLHDSTLDAINIAEISRRAGVTRSAFYFYFDNKQSAVAALMEQLYDEAGDAAGLLLGDGEPRVRVEAMVRGLFGAFDRSQHLYRAMLDARATNASVREMWDNDRLSFVPAVATAIREAQESGGRARRDPDALASVLLELNDRMLERLAVGGELERERLVDAVVDVWTSTIFGGPQ